MSAPGSADGGRLAGSARWVAWAVALLAVGVAVAVAVGAPYRPTGIGGLDPVYRSVAVAALVATGWFAPRWAVAVLGVTAAGLAIAAGSALAVAGGLVAAAAVPISLGPGWRTGAGGSRWSVTARSTTAGAVTAAGTAVVLYTSGSAAERVSWWVAVGAVGAVVVVTGGWRLLGALPRSLRWIAVGFGVATVLAGAVSGWTLARLSEADLRDGLDQVQAGVDAAGQGDRQGAIRHFDDASRSFSSAGRTYDSWWVAPIRLVPLAGRQLDAVRQATSSADELARSASRTAQAVDLEGLHVRGGQIDVDQLRRFVPPLESAAAEVRTVAARTGQIDRAWLLPPLIGRLDKLDRQLAEVTAQADLAAEGARMAPGLLGADGPRRYLVMVGDVSDARELGGAFRAYAVLGADHGRIRLEKVGTAESLDRAARRTDARLNPAAYPPAYLDRRPERSWADVTASPDFTVVARAAGELLPQSGGPAVDGVVYMDAYGLASLMRLTGPIRIPGAAQELTDRSAGDLLARDQYTQATGPLPRVGLLEQAAGVTFEQLITADLPGPREVVDALANRVSERRLMVQAFRPDESAFLHRLALDGAVPDRHGQDLVSVAHANTAASHLDAFLRQSVDDQVTFAASTGAIESRVTVTLRNEAPASGLPAEVIGGAATGGAGTNRMRLTLYTPLAVVDAAVDGRPASVDQGTESAWNRASVPVDVPPGSTTTVVVSLRGAIDRGESYRADLLTQPLVNSDEAAVRVHAADPLDGGARPGSRPAGSPCQKELATFGGLRHLDLPAAGCP